MKIDIEGGELTVLTDLIMSGSLADIDEIHVDWTNDPYVEAWNGTEPIILLKEAVERLNGVARELNLQHNCEIESIDDESYYDFNGPLPECQ